MIKALITVLVATLFGAADAHAMRTAVNLQPSWSSTAMTADRSTASFSMEHMIGVSCQTVWSGGATPVGNIKLQASNDGTNWSDVSGATSAVGANSGVGFFNFDGAHFRYGRVYFAFTSGNGTLSKPVCTLKGFGS